MTPRIGRGGAYPSSSEALRDPVRCLHGDSWLMTCIRFSKIQYSSLCSMNPRRRYAR
jgi:hypothetical protein